MGQTVSSILKEVKDDENMTTFLERRNKATSPYYDSYNTRKASFTTNPQGTTASSINHSLNMGQKLSSNSLDEITTRFNQMNFEKEEEEEKKFYLTRRQYTFGDALSAGKIQKETTYNGSGSQCKIVFVKESFPSLPQSEKRTTLEKKEETAPFLQPYNVVAQTGKKKETIPFIQPYNTVAQSEKKEETTPFLQPYNTFAQRTTSLMSEGTIFPLYRSSYKRYESMTTKEKQEKKGRDILKILHHLVSILRDNNKGEIYGFWQCEIRENDDPESEEKLSLDHLQKCLKNTPKGIYDIFNKNCNACKKEHLITSFRKYIRPIYLNDGPDLEIICHLLWNDHYRVYGEFKCPNCWKKWRSAYIWISFRKFIEKIPGPRLCKDEYYMQNCKKCKAGENDDSFILHYEPLQTSGSVKPHKRELCAKCQNREYCRQTGDYLGKNH
ncbi:16038_t:CDS:2 [Funneliformis geosporum]|uniref:1463_t:CDS:1 n=1 Tax=Funneliformis geosporum TaxID=1117311 RepID=A0A9W4WT68_9GLOM|nr:16038_t:CDS:2 [Funneliformis geosporum]CAI2176911.1 1463_t:CDS:2 [Funneliformis geosporum]